MTTTVVVSDLDGPTRADKFLANKYEGSLSRTQIKKSFDSGRVQCNGTVILPKFLLSEGDLLTFDLLPPPEVKLSPTQIPLDILFEDEHIVIINKPSGIVVHPGNGTTAPTLVEGVLSHCRLSTLGGNVRPGVVHRLDKDTTGTIIFAKSDEAYLKLIKMFAKHEIRKRYLAVVCGTFEVQSGTIDKPIGRHKTIKTKMSIRPDGRSALTDWAVIESFGKKFSLISVDLHTGRTHQIRVHLASIGHPLLGDETYGYHTNFDQLTQAKYPILHAHKLNFEHPITHKELHISAPLSPNFQEILQKLRTEYSA